MRRAAYEAVGGFREDLAHAADWEMWMRLARHGPLWFEDGVLARYRVHPEQDTSAQIRSGANIDERIAALKLVNAGLAEPRVRSGLLYSGAYAGRIALEQARAGRWRSSLTQATAAVRCVVAGVAGSTRLAERR